MMQGPTSDALDRLTSALHALSYGLTRPRAHDRLVAMAGVPIDRPGLALLRLLTEEGRPLRIGESADYLEVRSPNVTRVVQSLEQHGLVEHVPDPDDRRVRAITSTTAGDHAVRRVNDAARTWLADSLADVNPAAVDAATEVLQRLREHQRERHDTDLPHRLRDPATTDAALE